MIFKQLLEKVAREIYGKRLDNTSERSLVVGEVNSAAAEIWKTFDLVSSLEEQVYTVSSDYKRITLPYYVEAVRGVRPYPHDGVTYNKIEALTTKYQENKDNPYDSTGEIWRFVGIQPLERSIASATPITAILADEETSAVNVTIVGSTSTSERKVETLVFDIGDTEKTTSSSFTPFPGIVAIAKDIVTSNNVTLQDLNGNQIAMIANTELEARNVVIEIQDCMTALQAGQCLSWQILYKKRFTPFQNDYDVFFADGYADAIYWKCFEHYHAKQEGGDQKALLAHSKCVEQLGNITIDTQKSLRSQIDFGGGMRDLHNYDLRYGRIYTK